MLPLPIVAKNQFMLIDLQSMSLLRNLGSR